MRTLCAVLVILSLAITTIVIPMPSEASEAYAINNAQSGDVVVFNQNYSNIYAIPDNICMANEGAPNLLQNHTFDYDYSRRAVRVNWTNGNLGSLLVGGLSASVISTITLDIGFARSNFNTEFSIYAANTWMNVGIRNTAYNDSVRINSYYYYPTLLSKSNSTLIWDLQGDGRFTISIESNGVTRTNNIYLNGIWQFETPYCYNNEKNSPTSFDQLVNPYIKFGLGGPIVGNWGALRLYEITQTVQKYDYVTPIPDGTLVSFGLDGPHPYASVEGGIDLVKSYNGTGTIWADVGYIGVYSDENITAIKQLLANGWELGIHYSAGLTSKTMVQAIDIMELQYAQIATIFGQNPTTWCSLGNADNKSHADYAYANLDMIWRNGYSGVHGLNNVGNLCDNYWKWWDNASAAGIAMPSFTHETDSEPAISYSISIGNFTKYVERYNEHGMQIVGYHYYWAIAQNTVQSNVSGMIIENDSMLSFTLSNIGGKSRLLIDADFVELILDENGNEIEFEVTADGIIVEVEAGEYTLMTEAYYRQEQMNNAITPIFAIIPLVIILSVIPMVMGIGKKLK